MNVVHSDYIMNGFIIRCNMMTFKGTEPVCDYYIGGNRDIAVNLFRQLEGSDEAEELHMLQLDFIEIKKGLPVNVKIKHCTLLQMGSNCVLMTKELFKYRNLEGIF